MDKDKKNFQIMPCGHSPPLKKKKPLQKRDKKDKTEKNINKSRTQKLIRVIDKRKHKARKNQTARRSLT
jgi:hypothetical protein